METFNTMDALFRIALLGRFEVHYAGRKITRFRTQKTSALLAYLALNGDHSHLRGTLTEQFWPESDPKSALTNLRVALNALRNQLEPPGVPPGAVLKVDNTQVRLNPLAFTTDVEDFENMVQEAEAGKRVELWIRAADLYGGDLLPGFYEEWIFPQRERLRDTYLRALREVVREFAEKRRYEQALEYAHRMVQADPHREESSRNLIRLYLMVGRPQDALSQYQALESRLQNDLQTRPSPATRQLVRQLMQSGPRDTNRYRGTQPASETQSENPDAKAATHDPQRPSSRLPLLFTRFFGREEEIAHLTQMLSAEEPAPTTEALPLTTSLPALPKTRLVTLTGPGGTGKTRLALEVAGRAKEAFSGGVWFVALAELTDPLRLGETLRDSLELPHDPRTLALEQVIAYLQGRKAPPLLILDNFEQISAGGAPIVWTLLNRVPLLRCLVTSRRPLMLSGEREVPVSPLPIPLQEKTGAEVSEELDLSCEPRILLTYPGVALFVDRAQTARPDFQITRRNGAAITAICQKVEGIPLAIELAAAQVRTLTPAQILVRLSKRFELLATRRLDKGERHRSLWAAIEWSYHLLSPGLQRLFAGLSVFHGGWSLEAAEAVCDEPAALNGLTQLRGHSLILVEEQDGEIRFRMLETLREFAAEQLRTEERIEAERRHADYFQQWVTGAQYRAPERAAWFARFETELDNLRAVLAWSSREGNAIEIGLQTAGALSLFWHLRGHLSEGRRWYAGLLERAGGAPTRGLGQSLYGAGMLASQQGDFAVAQPLLERCLEVVSTNSDGLTEGLAHNELGSIAQYQAEHERARTHYETALRLARTQGRRDRVAAALGNLASIAHQVDDFTASRALNEESLALWREEGDRLGEARCLHNLGTIAFSQEQWDEARRYYEQSLVIKRELADRLSASNTLTGLAAVAGEQRDFASAASYAREGLALARELNIQVYLVSFLQFFVDMLLVMGEYPVLARMYGALERLREEMNYPLHSLWQEAYQRGQANVQESLGTAAFEAAMTEGRRLSLEQALVCVEETLTRHSL